MVLLITALWTCGRWEGAWRDTAWMKGSAILLLGWSVFHAAVDFGVRTRDGYPMDVSSEVRFVMNDARIEHWRKAAFWQRRDQLDLEPYARSLGITRRDKVLITVDCSWQVGLYLVGQTGWNDYTVGLGDSLSMAHAIRRLQPAYLYLTDPTWADRDYMKPYLTHPIGHHHGLDIYDLRPFQEAAPS